MLMVAFCLVVLLSVGAGAQDNSLSNAQNEAQSLLTNSLKVTRAKVELAPPKPGLSFRFPTWELGALVSQEAGSHGLSKLTEREKDIARWIYKDAIDLESVRVVFAPSPTDYPMTWGDTIRMPISQSLSTGTLIHELAHIWQYQTRGSSYISNSMLHQTCAVLAGYERDKAYEYKIVKGQSLFDYTAEQQAQIIEDYSIAKAKHDDPHYMALIAEMRTHRSFKDHKQLFLDRDFNLQPREKTMPLVSGWEVPFNGESGRVPQVELRF